MRGLEKGRKNVLMAAADRSASLCEALAGNWEAYKS